MRECASLSDKMFDSVGWSFLDAICFKSSIVKVEFLLHLRMMCSIVSGTLHVSHRSVSESFSLKRWDLVLPVRSLALFIKTSFFRGRITILNPLDSREKCLLYSRSGRYSVHSLSHWDCRVLVARVMISFWNKGTVVYVGRERLFFAISSAKLWKWIDLDGT